MYEILDVDIDDKKIVIKEFMDDDGPHIIENKIILRE